MLDTVAKNCTLYHFVVLMPGHENKENETNFNHQQQSSCGTLHVAIGRYVESTLPKFPRPREQHDNWLVLPMATLSSRGIIRSRNSNYIEWSFQCVRWSLLTFWERRHFQRLIARILSSTWFTSTHSPLIFLHVCLCHMRVLHDLWILLEFTYQRSTSWLAGQCPSECTELF